MIFTEDELTPEQRKKLKEKAWIVRSLQSLKRKLRFEPSPKADQRKENTWQKNMKQDISGEQTTNSVGPIQSRLNQIQSDEAAGIDIRRQAWKNAGGDSTSTPVDAGIILKEANVRRQKKDYHHIFQIVHAMKLATNFFIYHL